jgi:acetoacetyl-CoA reductase
MIYQNNDKRVALVTGGIGGIGTAVCKELYREGRVVYANYHPYFEAEAEAWQQRLAEEDYEIHLAPADVAKFDATRDMVRKVLDEAGSVDILVNCAGITRDRTLRKMDWEIWDEVLTTNLDSVFNVTRHVIDGMLERGFGRIVNISSVNGQKGQFGQTNYSAAKAGMHGFTMALAQEVARKGVTVNSVSPGYIETRMTEAVPEEIREEIVGTIPMGRMGRPEEIAHTVAFLTADGTTYITGANIPVNGGMYMAA